MQQESGYLLERVRGSYERERLLKAMPQPQSRLLIRSVGRQEANQAGEGMEADEHQGYDSS